MSKNLIAVNNASRTNPSAAPMNIKGDRIKMRIRRNATEHNALLAVSSSLASRVWVGLRVWDNVFGIDFNTFSVQVGEKPIPVALDGLI